METTFSGTISSGVIAVPADYLDFKFARVNSGTSSYPLKRGSASQVYESYPLRSSSARPQMIAREGSNFIFGPYPDGDYAVTGIYYAKPTSIQSTTNSLFSANPDLYLFAALCEAAPYIQDDKRIPVWENKYAQIVSQLNSEDSREYGSGGGLAVVAA